MIKGCFFERSKFLGNERIRVDDQRIHSARGIGIHRAMRGRLVYITLSTSAMSTASGSTIKSSTVLQDFIPAAFCAGRAWELCRAWGGGGCGAGGGPSWQNTGERRQNNMIGVFIGVIYCSAAETGKEHDRF